MGFPISIHAQQNEIRFRQVDGIGTVCYHVDQIGSHGFGLLDLIPEIFPLAVPEKGLAAAEKQNADSHLVQRFRTFTSEY